ncbi:MAG: pyridoxamine 5'-phosphate oxidase family protein [Pseudomonadota bacterium]
MAQMWTPATAARWARGLVHEAREAALGSLGADGQPHVSHVAVATFCDGSPVLLISDLAVHTKNLRRDNRASLLFVAPFEAGDTNARARVTLDGTIAEASDRDLAKARFLRRQPDAADYADFGDFRFMRLNPEAIHLVAGFGRITSLEPGQILAQTEAADAIAKMDAGGCEHMDEDHADAMELMATRLGDGPPGEWRAVGLDPLGIDMANGEQVLRVEFDEPATNGGMLRRALKTLTDRARAAEG